MEYTHATQFNIITTTDLTRCHNEGKREGRGENSKEKMKAYG
jgi:hypothetical protein